MLSVPGSTHNYQLLPMWIRFTAPIPLPQDCQPLRIVEVKFGYEYIVQCTTTSPHYKPARIHIVLNEAESEFMIDAIVQVDELTSFPGILAYNEPIAQTIFITNDILY